MHIHTYKHIYIDSYICIYINDGYSHLLSYVCFCIFVCVCFFITLIGLLYKISFFYVHISIYIILIRIDYPSKNFLEWGKTQGKAKIKSPKVKQENVKGKAMGKEIKAKEKTNKKKLEEEEQKEEEEEECKPPKKRKITKGKV